MIFVILEQTDNLYTTRELALLRVEAGHILYYSALWSSGKTTALAQQRTWVRIPPKMPSWVGGFVDFLNQKTCSPEAQPLTSGVDIAFYNQMKKFHQGD